MLAAAQILDAIAARLRGLPLAGQRVYTDRSWPMDRKDLPGWKVIAVDEDIEPMTVHKPTPQKHLLQVELLGHVRAVSGLDDAMHELASEALTALFNEPGSPDALSALASKVQLSQRRIERAMQGDAEAAQGLITVTLRAEFKTRSTDPDTLI